MIFLVDMNREVFWLKRAYAIYGIASIACPFLVGLTVILLYGSAHSAFWTDVLSHPEDDSNRSAGAMVGFSEFLAMMMATGISSVVGCVLGLISMWKQGKWFGVGFIGLSINAIPPVLFVIWLIRA